VDTLTEAGADVLAGAATRRYLRRTVRTWLGLHADSDVKVPELPEALARRLLRVEEIERPHRSSYDCWEHSFCDSFGEGKLRVPEVDEWLAGVRSTLPDDVLEPLWPPPHRFAVCLTHDVDRVSGRMTPAQILRHARGGAVGGRGPLERLARPPARVGRALARGVARVPSTAGVLERSVTLELGHGVRATYFFSVPPAGERSRYDCAYGLADPCVFRGRRHTVAHVAATLAAEGFDVGLHGSYGAAGDTRALTKERAALEQATGLEITTSRQHFLHWHVAESPRRQQEAGLRADSSLGFNRDVGFRSGSSLPYRQFDLVRGEPLRLLEVPLVVQDGALLGGYGLELDLSLARATVEDLVARVARVGGLITFLFHPDNLERPGYLDLFEFTLDHVAAAGAWVGSLSEIDVWWSEREVRLGFA
jgi:peptidoglycan/xylan/chitin deacetylase (PgdA/CDA1 family)